MKQISLFGDDNFEEAPKKNRKSAAPKPLQKPEETPEPIIVSDTVPKQNPAQVSIPLGDIKTAYDTDENSLEENYIREVFIFEEPAQEFAQEEVEENFEEEKVKEKKDKPKVETKVKAKGTRGRLKLSDTHLAASSIAVPDDETLFSKKYYSIGVVAKMFDVNISLLRYWENEFTILKPRKNGKGDRHFRPEDIKNLQLIHHLLREKKYTLEGAKDFLKKTKNIEDPLAIIENLKDLKSFLLEIKTNL